MTIFTPSSASRLAIAKPIPRLPPVMRATLFFKMSDTRRHFDHTFSGYAKGREFKEAKAEDKDKDKAKAKEELLMLAPGRLMV
jgi:hypothetical protein